MKILPIMGFVSVLTTATVMAKPADIYLYYNAQSADLAEISIAAEEIAKVFDDAFGPDSEELPQQVQYIDFFVSRSGDDGYSFLLNAPYNCGQLGCNTIIYRRDADGDLQPVDEATTPVKCKDWSADKLVCIKGGYKPDLPQKPKPKGPIHYPAPRRQ